jgi:tetratricopeptide (TPR) repeat protein
MDIELPERPLPYILHRSELLLEIDDILKETKNDFNKFVERAVFHFTAEYVMEQADELVARNRFQEAVNFCYVALQVTPFLFEAMRCMADCCFSLGQFDPAIRAYTATINVHPDAKDLHYQLGRCYFEKNELDKAIAEFEKELAISGEAEDLFIQLGCIHLEKGKEIVEEIVKAQIKDKKEIYQRVGNYFVKAGNYFQKVLDKNPSNTQIQEYLNAARKFLKEYKS